MTQNKDILQELNELESTLANTSLQNVYTVPVEYFENLANHVLNRIKAMNASTASEELEYLSPALNEISRQMPYSIPSGYFQTLENQLMQYVSKRSDYQTAMEELEALSPLLSSLNRQTPYSIPQGYFENLHKEETVKLNTKSKAKVISISGHKWLRYAVAAIITGAIALGSFLYFNQKTNDPVKSFAKFENKIDKEIKKTSDKELKEFVQQFTDAGLTGQEKVQTNSKEEAKELLKDVPDTELKKFLEETADSDFSDDETTPTN